MSTVTGERGPVGGPAVERILAWDIARRAVPVAPVLVLLAGLVRGGDGAASAAYGIAIVVVNLLLSAALLAWAARVSLSMIMVAALGGFVVRMALVTLAVLAVKEQSWADLPALGVTVLVTQLGLLAWETRYVSASLAFPDLKPTARRGA